MLKLAILLLLVAAGLLAATLVTGQLDLAWVSVGVSALAAIALLDWLRRVRRRRSVARDEFAAARDASADAGPGTTPLETASSPAERPVDPLLNPASARREPAEGGAPAALDGNPG